MLFLRLSFLIVLFLVLVSSFEDMGSLSDQYEEEQMKIRKNTCQMQPEFGMCKGRRILWYFNDRYGKCMKFTYSNCGGNRNRFFSKESCQEFCDQFDWKPDNLKHRRFLKRIKANPATTKKLEVYA